MISEDLNLLGDCVEAVYNQVDQEKGVLPMERIRKIMDSKTRPEDFEILKNIAKGGYGEVFLVKKGKVFAMKRVSKDLVLKQPHTALYMAEKEVLVDSIGSEWLVSAEMTLQDKEYLYYLMDFIPGGDFMGLLSKEDVLEEEWVRFYVVEIVAALDELHSLGWIHRDLKPDNILIGLDGHIRLADFGSCIKMKDGKARSSITVGTPDYVSPDILTSRDSENEYSENLDFWTLGVIIYEMLYGVTPFYSNTLVETYRKITEVDFIFPFKVGDTLKDLIQRLICRKEERLDIQGIKSHPFFEGIDWENVKQMKPPFIPEIAGESDTSHFIDSHFEVDRKSDSSRGEFLPFVGFSFDPQLVQYLKNLVLKGELEVNEVENNKEHSINMEEHKKEEKNCMPICPLTDDLSEKKKELEEMDKQLQDHKRGVLLKQDELKRIMTCVVSEKEELDNLEREIQEKTCLLKKIVLEIKDRQGVYEEMDKKGGISFGGSDNSQIVFEKLNSYVSSILLNYEVCSENLKSLREDMETLLETNGSLLDLLKKSRNSNLDLTNKLKAMESENQKMKKVGVDTLKKQVRILSSEIKEYQQKLDQEIHMRKKLEEELKSLQRERSKHESSSKHEFSSKYEFPCRLLRNPDSRDPHLTSSTLRIVDQDFFLDEVSSHINNVFLHELKNNELHHQSYKNRSLILKIIIIKESIKSVSSAGRRSIKSLEEDLMIEESMIKGLETMMTLLTGKPLEEATMQLKGSQRKISQLKAEIEMARKSTLTEDIPEDPIKLYEFNNHLFASKTFPQGQLCEHCNEVLYGIKDQGFECRDCKMVVHRACYVLGDVSCEMYNAFKNGESYYVIMRSIEDKEKLMGVYRKF